jgi:hypothetical protein
VAGPRGEHPKGLTPENVAAWLALVLQLADAVLRLFGRRSSDRPDRERASGEAEGPPLEPPR